MSENYDIQLAVDARKAESGLKTFDKATKGATSSLSTFAARAKEAFAQVDAASKTANFSTLAREAATASSGMMKMATEVAAAGRTVRTAMNEMARSARAARAALTFNIGASSSRNLSAFGRQITTFARQMQTLRGVAISPALARNLSSLAHAFAIFRVPSAAALGRLPTFFRELNSARISPALARGMMALSGATAGFRGITAAASRNLLTLLHGMQTVNASHINAVASALSRLHGFNFNLSAASVRAMSNIGVVQPRRAPRAFAIPGIAGTSGALRGLENTLGATYHLTTLLRVALGSLTLGSLVKGLFTATATMQQFDRMIEAVATSQEEVANNKAFVNQLTTDIPVALDVVQASFGRFNASIRLSGYSSQQAQKLFTQLSTSFAVLHLNTEQMSNAFLAVEEMFNKGTVTSQQLKRQLSQYLPAAFELTASSMGVTTAKLAHLMQQGEVSADVLFKLGDRLQEIYGAQLPAAMVTSRNQLTLFLSDYTKFEQNVGKSGFDSGLSAMFQTLRSAMGDGQLDELAKRLGSAFQTAFEAIGVAGSIALKNWQGIAKVVAALTGLASLAGAVSVIRMLVAPLGMVLGLAVSLGGGFVSFVGAVWDFAAAARAAAVGTTTWSAAMAVLTAPAWVAVAAVVALAAGLAALATFRPGHFVEDAKKVFNSITGVATSALKKITGGVADFAFPDADKLIKKFGGIGDAFTKGMKEAQAKVADYNHKMGASNEAEMAKNSEREKELLDQKMKNLDDLNKRQMQLLQKIDPIAKARADARDEEGILDKMLAKKLINEQQFAAYKKRLDDQNLAKTNPYEAIVHDMADQFEVLQKTGTARDTENKLLQMRNKLLKEGVDIEKGSDAEKALRNLIDAQRELEAGGSNGFERWASGVKDLREALIDVEKNGVESLSNSLADLASGTQVNFAKVGQSILRAFDKALIDSMLKDIFKNFKGNSPLADIFGLKGPDVASAIKDANKISKTIKPITTEKMLEQFSASNMAVTAGSVYVNGSLVPSAATPAGVFGNKAPTSDLSNAPGTSPGAPAPAGWATQNGALPWPKSGTSEQAWSPYGFAGGSTSAKPAGNPDFALFNKIKGFEGFSPKAKWDYQQYSNGYGTKAMSATESIDQATAQQRALVKIAEARRVVDRVNPNLDAGTRDALTSLTYNSGSKWAGAGLGSAVRSGDIARAKEIFMQYDHAGGAVNQGLFNRRAQEASWFGQSGASNAAASPFFTNATMSGTSPFAARFDDATNQIAAASSKATTDLTSMATGISGVGVNAMTAAPNLGDLGSSISKLLSGGSSSGAGGLFNLLPAAFSGGFKEGGVSISPVSGMSVALSAFRSAPHFAQGTPAATRSAGPTLHGGGFPAVLHDNEAVIPLTQGREVPVRLTSAVNSSNQAPAGNHMTVNLHGVKDFDSFMKSKSQMKAELASASQLAAQRNN